MMTYADKLRDPRWQRKRLEILNLHNFSCQDCGDSTSELHIHHVYYARGKDPWDYKTDHLKCLCSKCHDEHESVKNYFAVVFGVSDLKNQKEFIAHLKSFPNLFSDQYESATIRKCCNQAVEFINSCIRKETEGK
jgi:hypothetical protein